MRLEVLSQKTKNSESVAGLRKQCQQLEGYFNHQLRENWLGLLKSPTV